MHDLGTGTYTVMQQVAADALGLAPDKVTVRLGDTRLPASHAAIGSATMANAGAEETIRDGWLDTGDVMKVDDGGLSLVLRAQEADYRARRLEHLPSGGRGSIARASRGSQCRRRRHPRPGPRRERPSLHHAEARPAIPDRPGADRVRSRTGRLQGARGDCLAGRDAAQCDRQGGPCHPEADGGRTRRGLIPRGALAAVAMCSRSPDRLSRWLPRHKLLRSAPADATVSARRP